jgi:hypothetical protein
MFARLGISPWLQRDALGHQDVATTEGYTHLAIEEQRPAHEQLSSALPIADTVMASPRRATRINKAPRAAAHSAEITRGATRAQGRRFRRKA